MAGGTIFGAARSTKTVGKWCSIRNQPRASYSVRSSRNSVISASNLLRETLGSTNCSDMLRSAADSSLEVQEQLGVRLKVEVLDLLVDIEFHPRGVAKLPLVGRLPRVSSLFECLHHHRQERLLVVGVHLGRLTVDDDGQFNPHRDGPP